MTHVVGPGDHGVVRGTPIVVLVLALVLVLGRVVDARVSESAGQQALGMSWWKRAALPVSPHAFAKFVVSTDDARARTLATIVCITYAVSR